MAALHLFRDPPLDGPTNMARDEHLLYSDLLRPAALRLYAWEPPTISLGYFQQFAEVARLPEEVRGLPVVRRLTGGGAILHDREITYCLVVDDSLEVAHRAPLALYGLVHDCWRRALADAQAPVEVAPEHLPMPTPRSGPFFCFERPGRTDLLVGADKVLGSAQRRIRGRVLQHGSLILGRRFAAHPGASLGDPPLELVARWTADFIVALAEGLGLTIVPASWTHAQRTDIARRRAQYAADDWTRKR